jgi:hypothetical protein
MGRSHQEIQHRYGFGNRDPSARYKQLFVSSLVQLQEFQGLMPERPEKGQRLTSIRARVFANTSPDVRSGIADPQSCDRVGKLTVLGRKGGLHVRDEAVGFLRIGRQRMTFRQVPTPGLEAIHLA